MGSFWNVDNPVWKFIGRLADFFLLSVLWVIFSLPLVTMGAASTALYEQVMKMAEDQEGRLLQGFVRSFRANLRQGTAIWLGFLGVGALLAFDLLWAIGGTGYLHWVFFFTAALLSLAWLLTLSFVFPLLARVENTSWSLVKMAGAIVSRNLLPVLTGFILYAAFLAVGVFVFWPVLLVVPALPAYLSGRLYLRVLERYGLLRRPGEEAGEFDVS